MATDTTKLLNVKQVAELLGTEPNYVNALAKMHLQSTAAHKGDPNYPIKGIPSEMLPDSVSKKVMRFFRPEDIEAYMAGRASGTTSTRSANGTKAWKCWLSPEQKAALAAQGVRIEEAYNYASQKRSRLARNATRKAAESGSAG